VDARTKKPVAGAIIKIARAGVPPVASDAESGAFATYDLPAGRVRLGVEKEGYRIATEEVLLEAGRTATVEVRLQAIAKKARFAISVTSNSRPIVASITLKGPEELKVPVSGSGAIELEATPGHYSVNVTSPGHLSQARALRAVEGSRTELAFELAPKPKRSLVALRENKIEVRQQIHFAPGKASILADSYPLLAQLVDVIVKSGVKRLRIEGHTDNRGNRKVNRELSSQRARAVAEYLEQAGIDWARLETVGYGDSRPIAPNLTARGRELNRRVDLIIVEK
jgi:outer membrane protein OmpA-like peptidoglycan-associated protein